MSKKLRLTGFILIFVTIAYIIAFYLLNQNYNAWCEDKLLEYPPEVRPYVDFKLFWYTNLGQIMILLSLAIGSCWVAFIYIASNQKSKKPIIALTLIVFATGFCFTNLSVVYGSVEKYVDALVVRDEEWRAGVAAVSVPPYPIPIPISYNATAEIAMELVAERFNETSGIEIRWHYWIEWDSDDGQANTVSLLLEVIQETGFQPGMLYNGYVIDMLVAFCGQDMDMHGLSPPDSKALILDYVWHYRVDNLLQHEFSHQFYAEHCSHSCIMNKDCVLDPFKDVTWWCSDCQTTIQAHADRF